MTLVGTSAEAQDERVRSDIVECHVDFLTRSGAKGWVWIPSYPQCSLDVEAVADDKVIGSATANLPRRELMARRRGTGRYGFELSFSWEGNGLPTLRTRIPLPLNSPQPLVQKGDAEPAAGAADSLAMLLADHARFTKNGPDFEEFDPGILREAPKGDSPGKAPLLLAFYLPQFHAVPENDRFWGRGFTEWRQLPRGLPRYPGHYQPRVPRDLGYYNLADIQSIRGQVELARAAGIGGFAFYYYHFDHGRVLHAPLEEFLRSELDMPFIIIWANESWARVSPDASVEILLQQSYGTHESQFLADLARHFEDKRYIRVGGRPLFVIYNPHGIPDAPRTIERWRSILGSKFHVEPLMYMAQTFGHFDPRPYRLDGALEFPPHKLGDALQVHQVTNAYSREFSGTVSRYDDFVAASLFERTPAFPLIKTAVPSWDNDARYPNAGFSLAGLAPRKYQAWLESLILRAIDTPILDTPIVAINAWNEWAEAAYLEPDVYYGASFLNATARAYAGALRKSASGTVESSPKWMLT